MRTPPPATGAPAIRSSPATPASTVGTWLLVAALCALVAVALGGAAPTPAPAGLPDPGPVPGWTSPLVDLVGQAAALTVVGALLAALLAAVPVRRPLVVGAAVAWALSSAVALVLGLSEVVAQPVGQVLEPELLDYYAFEVPQGRALLLSACLAVAVAVVAAVPGRPAVVPLLLLALVALVPPLLNGHAASQSSHRAAQVTLVVHVLAGVLWVGGLAALVLLPSSGDLAAAARRYSPLALLCAVAVGTSGGVGAWLRLEPLSQLWTTGYGALLLVKTAAFVLLVGAGARHRAVALPSLSAGTPGAFRRLATGEVTVMALAYGVAVALSRTPLG